MKSRYIEIPRQGVVELKTEDVSTEDLARMEVVVRNEASLVSAGTELSGVHNTLGNHKYPSRTGYASVGRVLARGEGVDDFAVGDRVFFAGKHAEVQRFVHGQDHQWGRLYEVPDDVAIEDAPYCCLGQIAYVGPMVTELSLTDTVAVFGLGVIGNLAAQYYQMMGARVIALDPVAKRCELAREVGLETVLDVPPAEQVQAVKDLTGGDGADVTVDVVGHSAVIENCVAATKLFGQVVLLGSPRAPYQTDMTATMKAVHGNGLVVRGAHMWRIPAMEVRGPKHNVVRQYRMVFDLIRDGRLKVAPLRSHFAKPERAPEMYDGLQNKRDEYWGVVFDWSE